MPFLGKTPVTTFEATTAVQRFNGDGSDTTFTLSRTVSSVQDVLVSVDGVIQEPSVAYAVSSGTTLTFTAAPSSNSGNNIFVYYLHRTIGTVTPPVESTGTYKASGIFRTNVQTLSDDITITATENANVTGPLTVASNKTITVNDGGRLVIL